MVCFWSRCELNLISWTNHLAPPTKANFLSIVVGLELLHTNQFGALIRVFCNNITHFLDFIISTLSFAINYIEGGIFRTDEAEEWCERGFRSQLAII